MSNPAHSPRDHQRFSLQARPPTRAYLISGVASIVGAVLLVVALNSRWPVAVVLLGMFLMACGLVLSTTALLTRSRYQTTIVVERDSVTLINGRRRRVLNWTEVGDVKVQGPHLIFSPQAAGGRTEVVLFDKRQTNTGVFQDLVTALRHRLDISRGYKPL